MEKSCCKIIFTKHQNVPFKMCYTVRKRLVMQKITSMLTEFVRYKIAPLLQFECDAVSPLHQMYELFIELFHAMVSSIEVRIITSYVLLLIYFFFFFKLKYQLKSKTKNTRKIKSKKKINYYPAEYRYKQTKNLYSTASVDHRTHTHSHALA